MEYVRFVNIHQAVRLLVYFSVSFLYINKKCWIFCLFVLMEWVLLIFSLTDYVVPVFPDTSIFQEKFILIAGDNEILSG